jgi:uncharacterized protein (TIGR03437 family)
VAPQVPTGAAGDGTAGCVNTVQVAVGDRVLTPDFAGLAAGVVGLYQISVRIPADLTATGDVPVKLTVAGVDSNTATIALR